MTWQGNPMTSGYRIVTNTCQGCQSVAVGAGVYDNAYNMDIIIVAPS